MARPQSVAEHSFRVAVLAMELTFRYHQLATVGPDALAADLVAWSPGMPRPHSLGVLAAGGLTHDRLYEILRWALVHDGPEVKTGDFPAPVKRFLTREAIDDLEDESCDWYRAERPHPESFTAAVVHLADLIESISWVSRYGQALRDRYDGENIEFKLRHRLQTDTGELDKRFPNLEAAVQQLVAEVAP